jgi:predicted CXXCH cytochrome family protein
MTNQRISTSQGLALLLCACIAGCGEAPIKTLAPEESRETAELASESVAPAVATAALPVSTPAFVKDASCRDCHEDQFTGWLDSHHERAMDHASVDTVLGDFNDTTFSHFDEHWRFFREGETYKVGVRTGEGEESVYPVEYTFGVTPLQQYLVPFPGGRYQCVPVSWDVEKKRWYHLYPDEALREGDPIHWTGRLQNWNYMCAECHSTNVQKGFDDTANTFNTTFSDINVGCQACHGPGSTHLEWSATKELAESPGYNEYGLVVDYKGQDSAYQVDQCARCHSRRAPAQAEDAHGRAFLDNFQLSTLQENLYFPDGQIQDEVYVYGSFVQSRMYHGGVRCTDCHDPHSARLLMPGNDLCVRCHQDVRLPQFPTLEPGIYDDRSHHFHEPGTPGAQCVNCHMPDRVYMGIDARRDHSFRVPRPDLSQLLGTPNACNQCHEDKDAAWAEEAMVGWYGEKSPEARGHFATAIAAGRRGDRNAEASLVALTKDAKVPAIVRATAMELLQGYGGEAAGGALLTGLKDENALVRVQALGGMDRLPPEVRGEVLGPLVMDPMASVRIGAARLLAGAPGLPNATRAALSNAKAEYEALQKSIGDQPEAHLNLALICTAEGNLEAAEAAYRKAITRDAQFIPARVNLANLLNGQGRNDEAEHLLMEAIGLAPNEGELQYSMGLLLAEGGRLEEAVVYMKRASELMPERGRVFYNYGLLLQHLEKRVAAEAAMKRSHELSPEDGGVLQALVILYSQDGRWDAAKPYARALLALEPDNPQLQAWVADILRR